MSKTAPKSIRTTWPIWLISSSCLVLGLSSGLFVGVQSQKDPTIRALREASELKARVAMLNELVASQSERLIAIAKLEEPISNPVPVPDPYPDASVTQTVVTPTVATVVVNSTEEELKTRKKSRAAKEEEVREESTVTVVKRKKKKDAESSTIQESTPVAAPKAEPIVAAAAPEAPAKPAISERARIEGVNKATAGISSFTADMVTFKSGLQVRVGSSFPSGEKLIGIDTNLGKIITDQRQIVILDHKQ